MEQSATCVYTDANGICYIRLKFIEGAKALRVDDIIYMESAGHKCTVHDTSGECHIYMKLDEIEALLEGESFLRIHKSYLVNMKHLQRISGYEATLKDGSVLPVPKARYKSVQRIYSEYIT